MTTQTGCAVALRFGIVPADRARRASRTRWRGWSGTRTGGWHRLPGHAAGAAGARPTPGCLDEAYLMLLRREMPSWLYQVRPGRDHGLGALGRDPARRVDPPGDDATPPRCADRKVGAAHAVVQPLRLRRGHRLGVPPRGRARARRREARATGRWSSRPGRSRASTGRAASVETAYGRVAIDWRLEPATAASWPGRAAVRRPWTPAGAGERRLRGSRRWRAVERERDAGARVAASSR